MKSTGGTLRGSSLQFRGFAPTVRGFTLSGVAFAGGTAPAGSEPVPPDECECAVCVHRRRRISAQGRGWGQAAPVLVRPASTPTDVGRSSASRSSGSPDRSANPSRDGAPVAFAQRIPDTAARAGGYGLLNRLRQASRCATSMSGPCDESVLPPRLLLSVSNDLPAEGRRRVGDLSVRTTDARRST